ncbi:hypothetical protein [Roseovarius sp. SYSU LYC5161]
MALTTLTFSPDQVASVDNIGTNDNNPNQADIEILKTFADVTV